MWLLGYQRPEDHMLKGPSSPSSLHQLTTEAHRFRLAAVGPDINDRNMSKRTVFTTITPLPTGITRETVLETLHNHFEMIEYVESVPNLDSALNTGGLTIQLESPSHRTAPDQGTSQG